MPRITSSYYQKSSIKFTSNAFSGILPNDTKTSILAGNMHAAILSRVHREDENDQMFIHKITLKHESLTGPVFG